jgi:hypothetical protein
MLTRESEKTYTIGETKLVEISVRTLHYFDQIGLLQPQEHDPGDPEVQMLAARQHAWLENFYPVSAELFRGLGELYTTNQEFRAFYDRVAPGLAGFLKQAMDHYAETVLEK